VAIHVLRSRATAEQIDEMLQVLVDYIKVAVGCCAMSANALKDRFLRDEIPVRIGNLASNLSRIATLSDLDTTAEASLRVLTESVLFIEWTRRDADSKIGDTLAALKDRLNAWQADWQDIWARPEERKRMAAEAQSWSDRLLAESGLLD